MLKSFIKRHIREIPGWRTERRIVVFESDDWGSIRMPSLETYNRLLSKGIRVDNCPYSRYDSLASELDLASLFEVLASIKGSNGEYATITANTIVANPDFEKIRLSGFKTYFFEPFTETLKRYPNHRDSFLLWQQGIQAGVFKPQFHGREHLNVNRWLKSLQGDNDRNKLAFNYQMYDMSESDQISNNSFVDAYNFESEQELEQQAKSIVEGLSLFERLFKYRATSFIAPCHIWSSKLNKTLRDNGIESIQGNWFQLEPKQGRDHRFRKTFHFTGQINKLGQVYLVRNTVFEPSLNLVNDLVGDCLRKIEVAFLCNKPAIISTHRLNYISQIDPHNAVRSLTLLKDLLKRIVHQWPEVEFMNSEQLASLIVDTKKKR